MYPFQRDSSICFSRILTLFGGLFLLLKLFAAPAQCQQLRPATAGEVEAGSLPDGPKPNRESEETTAGNLVPHLLKDQKAIWTSPARLRTRDLRWMLPLAAGTGIAFATDRHAMRSVVSRDPDFNQANVDASNVLVGGLIAAPVALYGLGLLKGNDRARETGMLGGEAILDSLVVEQSLKLATWRERPSQGNRNGDFFQGNAGWDSSFPSSHCTVAWSSAAVIAGEYPSRWAQIGVYSLATGVSLTRVMGQEHFPSDVLIGSAAGWLIGHYVYRHHHRHDLR